MIYISYATSTVVRIYRRAYIEFRVTHLHDSFLHSLPVVCRYIRLKLIVMLP